MYIGSTLNVRHRFNQHITKSTNNELREDMSKLGIGYFIFRVLEFIEFDSNVPKSEMILKTRQREQYFIDTLLMKDGIIDGLISYNKSPDSMCNRCEVSNETRQKMSKSATGKKLSEHTISKIKANHLSKKDGYVSWTKGKPLTDEHKQSIYNGLKYRMKPVLQYNLDGVFIREYDNIAVAAKETGARKENIGKCANGISKMCNGFIWKHHQENYPLKISGVTKIIVYDINNMVEVGRFRSFLEMQNSVGIDRTEGKKALENNKQISNYFLEYEK